MPDGTVSSFAEFTRVERLDAFIMPGSSVEFERKCAAYRAAQQAIGRQLQDLYEIPQQVPVNIEALVHQLDRCDEPQPALPGSRQKVIALLVVECTKQRARTAHLLGCLRIKLAEVSKTIETSHEIRKQSRARRLAAEACASAGS
jgi:hypothetical protein